MKKFRLLLVPVMLLLSVSLLSCDKEKTISESELPTTIKTYLATHFANDSVTRIEKEKKQGGHTYEIKLASGTKLDFNTDLEIVDIDGTAKLPDSVIPAKILAYVNTNYPSNVITDWEKDRNEQEVELNNGLNLVFSLEGDFIRIDD